MGRRWAEGMQKSCRCAGVNCISASEPTYIVWLRERCTVTTEMLIFIDIQESHCLSICSMV